MFVCLIVHLSLFIFVYFLTLLIAGWPCTISYQHDNSFSILELQKLKAQVVTEIRSNQQLEHDLQSMDIKIGLLVRNKITLQVTEHINVTDLKSGSFARL